MLKGLPKVKTIEYVGKADVYNMCVDKYHNFSVEGGIILHNCDALRYYVNTAIQQRRIAGERNTYE